MNRKELLAAIPGLEKFQQACDDIQSAQALVERARIRMRETLNTLAKEIHDQPTLRDALIGDLYWNAEDISLTQLCDAFGGEAVKEALNGPAGTIQCEASCVACGKHLVFGVTSKNKFNELNREYRRIQREGVPPGLHIHGSPLMCNDCTEERRAVDRLEQEREKQTKEQIAARLEELRWMPYREYLQTPEWQYRRAMALRRAWFRCQVCNAKGVELNTHHRTYERRGQEHDRDLIVLCRNCHETFHREGRLAE